MTRVLRYIRHSDIPEWEALGWHNLRCLGGTCHGEWSELMEWRGEGEPAQPVARWRDNEEQEAAT